MLSFAPGALASLRPLHMSALFDLLAKAQGARPEAPEARSEGAVSTNPLREQAVTAIMEFNPGATRRYLDQFGDRAIERYHRHLEASRQPRGRDAAWVREANEPTIVVMAA